jgi:hypothetical protein
VNSLLLQQKKSKPPSGGEEHIFHLMLPQKICGTGLGKSVAGFGFARSRCQKKMIGLWIKSVKISILKQKKPQILWISN